MSVDAVDPITGACADAQAWRRALVDVIRGRRPQTAPPVPAIGSFDGGARTLPQRPPLTHNEWLLEVLRGERLGERRDTSF